MKNVTKRVASILLIAILALSFVTLPAHAVLITSVIPGSGDKGDTIEVKGSGVQGGRTINLYWDLVQDWSAADGAGLLNSTKAKASGAWEVWFDVPEATNGTHYLYIEDSYTLEWDSELFYVYPKISLSSTSGLANDNVDVDGYGFSREADVAIIFHDVPIATVSRSEASVIVGDGVETVFVPNTNDFKSFSKEVPVPNFSLAEAYQISVLDENGVLQTKDFTIGPVILRKNPLFIIFSSSEKIVCLLHSRSRNTSVSIPMDIYL